MYTPSLHLFVKVAILLNSFQSAEIDNSHLCVQDIGNGLAAIYQKMFIKINPLRT